MEGQRGKEGGDPCASSRRVSIPRVVTRCTRVHNRAASNRATGLSIRAVLTRPIVLSESHSADTVSCRCCRRSFLVIADHIERVTRYANDCSARKIIIEIKIRKFSSSYRAQSFQIFIADRFFNISINITLYIYIYRLHTIHADIQKCALSCICTYTDLVSREAGIFRLGKDNGWQNQGRGCAVGQCSNEVNGGKELLKFVIRSWAPGCEIVLASLHVNPFLDFEFYLTFLVERERERESLKFTL